jgi:hypothetical protein
MNQLQTKIFYSHEELSHAEIEEWQILNQTNTNFKVFDEPDVVMQFFSLNAKNIFPLIIFMYEDNKLICVAPLYLKDQNYPLMLGVFKLFNFKLRVMRLLSNNLLIKHSKNEINVYEHLFHDLQLLSNKFDLFIIDNVSSHNEEANPVSYRNKISKKCFNVATINTQKDIIRLIDFPETLEEYLSSISYKSRTNYRKAFEKFEKQTNNSFQFNSYSKPDEVNAFFDLLNEVYAKTWQAQVKGKKQRNLYQDIELHKKIAEKNMLLGYILFKDQVPIAFILGYVSNKIFLHYEIGFDKQLRKLQPGKVLEWLLIHDLYQHHDIKTVDYDSGENDYKKILGNRHYFCDHLLISKKYSTGSFVIMLQTSLRKLYLFVKSILIKLRIDQKIRSLIKHR